MRFSKKLKTSLEASTWYVRYINVIKSIKVMSNLKKEQVENTERRKEQVENADLCKSILFKIMTAY